MGRKLRILFVEDPESDAVLIARVLRKGGLPHEFKRVASAQAMVCAMAEGVETEEQLACLLTWNCDLVQGRLFGAPFPPEGFKASVMDSQPSARRFVQSVARGCLAG